MNSDQIQENITLEQALRRANLLAAAAEVSQNLTLILDIDTLLPKTVDIICEAYDFYYAGVFLIDETGEFAVLRAGRGEPGRIMMENNHKLAVGGNSMIGACTALNEARISLDVDTEKVWYPNPVLPETRSEMALPLAVGNTVIGAVTVQSVEAAAFSEEDISSLQAMANQLAIAIANARQRRELEEAHAELLRTKTFEAIATATGDAIHWIGNKAEPIHGAIDRIRDDIQTIAWISANLLKQSDHPLAQLLQQETAQLEANRPRLVETAEKLSQLSPEKLEKRLSLASILEDLEIVDRAAALIMQVKEELIGPAREQAPRPTLVEDVIKDALARSEVPAGIVVIDEAPEMEKPLLAMADPLQLNRVFVNLLKNAYEAMTDQPDPQITIAVRPDSPEEPKTILIDITDNGEGIPPEDRDKIWVTFHTTKGIKGHAGLGLPACRLILDHIGGDISMQSQPGVGSTFTVRLLFYEDSQEPDLELEGDGKILFIDDKDKWLQFAASTLEAVGYKVAVADGDSSYDQYDLIVVDDLLIEQDSQELLRQISEAGAIHKTLVVSSSPRVERAKELKLLGVQNITPKPYTPTGLLAEVQKALDIIQS